MDWLQSIESAQKILDRILFIAFAERTDLLPDRLLEKAASAKNEFAPAPLWENFRNLFRFVDVGRPAMAIPAYNGGLFAADPALDGVVIPDPLASDLAQLGKWDYRREVPVTVLGRIFEQSITDIEALKAEATGSEAPKIGKRKRDGVVYTPDAITRFLVEKTLGLHLRECFSTLWAEYGSAAGEESERSFWRAYLDALRRLKIVDPACGSGAFLVAAFDRLAEEYRRATSRLEELGDKPDFDWLDEIVTRNLYGVDLNPESVEITRLALWLKTARRDHRLQNLEATIRCGDSLIEDRDMSARAFVWEDAFPEVFAQGGFDLVIGNPPYVRMELIKPIKPYLEKHYIVADERTDLYAYFFERGVQKLKDGGRLGYISSSTFFRTGAGEKLRVFLTDELAIEAIIDFGDLQMFEGVTTYPAIVTLRKTKDGDDKLGYLVLKDDAPADLERAFDDAGRSMPRARLGSGSWRLEDDALAALRDKIAKGRKTLGEVYGSPLYGIKTGLNDAFVIDRATRDKLVKADPKSAEILKPFLRGENIKRWRVESEDLWLINTPRGKVQIDDYPAVRDWLLPFRTALEKRATKQEWWELQQAQLAYQAAFETKKILFLDIASARPFTEETDGAYIDCTVFMIAADDEMLLPLLSSGLTWFQLLGRTPIASGGFLRLKAQYVKELIIPDFSRSDAPSATVVIQLARTCTDCARERLSIEREFYHRLFDLAASANQKLTRKLKDFASLDFVALRAEIKKALHAEIPVKERKDWEEYHRDASEKVRELTLRIEQAEREIDAIVYRLFDLTSDEIALVEASVAAH